ncbi:unnamed protein product [Hydatigera taeniaeformis]|uniref:Secreted protein n=1 Tax=Hydatigena taeniaeformis TaxID=6205 RepID=A0A0R3XC75_HYDTA|nr:unnamed protein product [Hydatigera taeniaeformis]
MAFLFSLTLLLVACLLATASSPLTTPRRIYSSPSPTGISYHSSGCTAVAPLHTICAVASGAEHIGTLAMKLMAPIKWHIFPPLHNNANEVDRGLCASQGGPYNFIIEVVVVISALTLLIRQRSALTSEVD